jgi:thiamine pyrophosphate-dependent acetolactate synthase large subunit-like protein
LDITASISILRPAEKILSESDDGGFPFSAMEPEMAIRLGAHCVHTIWIDGANEIVGAQEKLKYGCALPVDFGSVDYRDNRAPFGTVCEDSFD